MKAIINKENWTIELDNEAIKAIRFCSGFPTDLRIKLTKANKDMMYDWIEQNKLGLFGVDFMDLCVPADDENWHKYERMLWNVVNQVIDY